MDIEATDCVIHKCGRIKNSDVTYEESNKILYIYFSQDIFFIVHLLLGIALYGIATLIDSVAIVRLLSAFILIFL